MMCLGQLVDKYLFDNDTYVTWLENYDYKEKVELMKQKGEDFKEVVLEVFRDEFINDVFNNWGHNDDYNFWSVTEVGGDEVSAKDFFEYLKSCCQYFKDYFDITLDIATMTEEKVWNTLAYWLVSDEECGYSDVLEEKFVKDFTERVRDELNQEEEEGRIHPLTCDICCDYKQIVSVAACCVNKKFCRTCYNKVQYKPCPFCRGCLESRFVLRISRKIKNLIDIIPEYVKLMNEKWANEKTIKNLLEQKK